MFFYPLVFKLQLINFLKSQKKKKKKSLEPHSLTLRHIVLTTISFCAGLIAVSQQVMFYYLILRNAFV